MKSLQKMSLAIILMGLSMNVFAASGDEIDLNSLFSVAEVKNTNGDIVKSETVGDITFGTVLKPDGSTIEFTIQPDTSGNPSVTLGQMNDSTNSDGVINSLKEANILSTSINPSVEITSVSNGGVTITDNDIINAIKLNPNGSLDNTAVNGGNATIMAGGTSETPTGGTSTTTTSNTNNGSGPITVYTSEMIPGADCVCVTYGADGAEQTLTQSQFESIVQGGTANNDRTYTLADGSTKIKPNCGDITTRKYACTIKPGLGNFQQMFAKIIKYLINIVLLLGVLAIAGLGVAWTWAGGDDVKAKSTLKKWGTNIVIGLIILFFFRYILGLLAPWIYQ